LASACLIGWATFALFSDQATRGALITAGNFDVVLGDMTWNSPTQSTSGNGASTLESLDFGGGDIVVIDQEIRTRFTGNNLEVTLGLDWADQPAGSSATWHLADAAGLQVAPSSGEATLDQRLAPAGLVAADETNWRVVVTLTMPAVAGVYGDPAAPPEPTALPLGTLAVTADQVRG